MIDEHGKIERIPYELCVLRALRDALRRREIYVCGAHRWRNPDEDLPADFEANRDVHYAAIRKPRDPQAFVTDLQARLHAGLHRLDDAVSRNTAGGVRVTNRRGRPWIVVPAMDRLPDPPNIQALHGEIQRRHGMLDLLGVLKDADHVSDFTDRLTSVASREITDPVTARRRKLLVAFGIEPAKPAQRRLGVGGVSVGRLSDPLDPDIRPCTSTAKGCAERSSRSSTRRYTSAT